MDNILKVFLQEVKEILKDLLKGILKKILNEILKGFIKEFFKKSLKESLSIEILIGPAGLTRTGWPVPLPPRPGILTQFF